MHRQIVLPERRGQAQRCRRQHLSGCQHSLAHPARPRPRAGCARQPPRGLADDHRSPSQVDVLLHHHRVGARRQRRAGGDARALAGADRQCPAWDRRTARRPESGSVPVAPQVARHAAQSHPSPNCRSPATQGSATTSSASTRPSARDSGNALDRELGRGRDAGARSPAASENEMRDGKVGGSWRSYVADRRGC